LITGSISNEGKGAFSKENKFRSAFTPIESQTKQKMSNTMQFMTKMFSGMIKLNQNGNVAITNIRIA
jgi:hypothetical protein